MLQIVSIDECNAQNQNIKLPENEEIALWGTIVLSKYAWLVKSRLLAYKKIDKVHMTLYSIASSANTRSNTEYNPKSNIFLFLSHLPIQKKFYLIINQNAIQTKTNTKKVQK